MTSVLNLHQLVIKIASFAKTSTNKCMQIKIIIVLFGQLVFTYYDGCSQVASISLLFCLVWWVFFDYKLSGKAFISYNVASFTSRITTLAVLVCLNFHSICSRDSSLVEVLKFQWLTEDNVLWFSFWRRNLNCHLTDYFLWSTKNVITTL